MATTFSAIGAPLVWLEDRNTGVRYDMVSYQIHSNVIDVSTHENFSAFVTGRKTFEAEVMARHDGEMPVLGSVLNVVSEDRELPVVRVRVEEVLVMAPLDGLVTMQIKGAVVTQPEYSFADVHTSGPPSVDQITRAQARVRAGGPGGGKALRQRQEEPRRELLKGRAITFEDDKV